MEIVRSSDIRKADIKVLFVQAKCPYCGLIGSYGMDAGNDNLFHNMNWLVHCDIEEGGCDRMFMMKVELDTTVTSCKIEGQEPPE